MLPPHPKYWDDRSASALGFFLIVLILWEIETLGDRYPWHIRTSGGFTITVIEISLSSASLILLRVQSGNVGNNLDNFYC